LGILLLLAYGETLRGLAQQHLSWKEDSYKGRLLSELENELAKRGQSLEPVGSSDFYGVTGREIKPSERLTRFQKGNEYRWFRFGTAVNLGYVVSEQENGRERIVEIIHGRSVDSL
jgi:hypothetical protein